MRELLRWLRAWAVYALAGYLLVTVWWRRECVAPVPAPVAAALPCTGVPRDIALWAGRWEEALQRGRGGLPADLSFELGVAVPPGELHITSYHFARGGALANWADWLRAAAPQSGLMAFVPSREAGQAAAAVAGVTVAEAGRVLDDYVLCQRDPGSGIKVRALMELMRRGHDVWYSDADVVWRKAPQKLGIVAGVDLAIQIYGNGEGAASGQFGLNMGLWWARNSARMQGVARKLFRAMARSFAVRGDGMDTCNDQNCLNGLLMRWQPGLVCGWHFRGTYYKRKEADPEACIVLQLLDPRLAATAADRPLEELRDDDNLVGLHMTGYRGGHSFAKSFALRELGLWRAPREAAVPGGRYLMLSASEDSAPLSPKALAEALTLALLAGRSLVLPRRVQCKSSAAGCSVESQYEVDRMLQCNRALMGIRGYGDVPDKLACTDCARFDRSIPNGLFVLRSDFAEWAKGIAPRDVSWRQLIVERTTPVARLTDTPPPHNSVLVEACFVLR